MKITVYSTPTCPYCKMAKEFLQDNSLDFEEIDVSVDHEAAQKMVEKSGQMGVPVIIVEKDDNEVVLLGFDKEKLASEVGISL